MDERALAAEIDAALRCSAVPGRAAQEKRYLKSELEHYGTPVPGIRAVAKGVRKAHADLHHDELLTLVLALWETPVHERRMAAVELLVLYSHTFCARPT